MIQLVRKNFRVLQHRTHTSKLLRQSSQYRINHIINATGTCVTILPSEQADFLSLSLAALSAGAQKVPDIILSTCRTFRRHGSQYIGIRAQSYNWKAVNKFDLSIALHIMRVCLRA